MLTLVFKNPVINMIIIAIIIIIIIIIIIRCLHGSFLWVPY